MANTYHQMYIQAVFAVKFRNAVIEKFWRADLMAVIGNLINETGCKTLIVNGVEDHVHCFFGLVPSVSVSQVLKPARRNHPNGLMSLEYYEIALNGKLDLARFLIIPTVSITFIIKF